MKQFLIMAIITLTYIITPCTYADVDHTGKLGIGLTDQLANGLDGLSFKIRKSRSTAFGGVLGLSTKEIGGGIGAGLKFYRYLIEEPYLNFYTSAFAAFITRKTAIETQTGFQVDITLGSEFHFPSLESIGFSFEFGASMNKLDEFVFETVGKSFVSAGIHFYDI
ncbi:MAG: hypothetical protein H6622_09705 [Halobacteriovoraceae bacterium]|nr:hypothetical protein [Halobacteriovoraceae bacterium]